MSKISLWGHSAGLRIPSAILRCAGMRIGDEVHVRSLECGDLLVRAAKRRVVTAIEAPDGCDPPDVGRELTAEEILAKW